jgi:LysR family hydrogen peroxide-inducible transcriptional activator
MDLRHLHALVAVADHGSFSAAARALHTVQSNVSAHVATLERELGVALYDRSAGQLTEEGRAVVERTRRIDGELDALVADVASVHSEVTGTARIGIIGTTARWLTPQLLLAVEAIHPRLHVVVTDATTTSLLPQLVGGELDLAVVALPVDDTDIEHEPLFDEDLVLVTAPDHPLGTRSSVTIEDLAQYPLLLGAKGTALRQDLDEAAARAGVALTARAEIDGMRLLASLAFEGFGAAVLPAAAVPRWYPGEFRSVLVEGAGGRSVALARRRRGLPSAPARALRDVLLRVVAEEAPQQPGLHLPTTVTAG